MNADVFKHNLDTVIKKVSAACAARGRDSSLVRIMAVTKTHTAESVRIALSCGQHLFGENRVKEAEEKYAGIAGPCELHLIGHLQRNKAQTAGRVFSCVQSIDKFETALALDGACERLGKSIDVLVEVNTSGEASKSGVRSRDEYARLLESVAGLRNIAFRGLMTVGPLTDDRQRIRGAFTVLREMFEETKKHHPKCDILSMGMSSDFEIAAEEGATLLRIGTALFGERLQNT